MLATRESGWGTAGCSGWSGKANLEKKASPVLILSKRNTRSLELTVLCCKANSQEKQGLYGEDAKQAEAILLS